MLNKATSDPLATHTIVFSGENLVLDAAGAIFWPTQNLLIVADLHLEKGSYFVQRGNPLPNYDTRDSLHRLEQLIIRYQPAQLVCLGDNLHDFHAIERMHPTDYDYLCRLNHKTNWLWLIGNHDTASTQHPLLKPFKFTADKVINSVLLTHDFRQNVLPQIIGHFHPKASLTILAQKIKGKCFIMSEQLIIMPAFGSFTGGLDTRNPIFEHMFGLQKPRQFLLKNGKIFPIP